MLAFPGCGFVQFVERGPAEVAMAALNGTVLGATAIRITWGRSTSRAPAPALRDAAAGLGAYGGGGGAVGGYPAAALGGGYGAMLVSRGLTGFDRFDWV